MCSIWLSFKATLGRRRRSLSQALAPKTENAVILDVTVVDDGDDVLLTSFYFKRYKS